MHDHIYLCGSCNRLFMAKVALKCPTCKSEDVHHDNTCWCNSE